MLRLYILTLCVSLCEWNSSNIIKSFKKSFCLICIGLFDFSRSDSSFMPVTERWLVVPVTERQPKWTEMYFLFKCPADRNTSNTIKSFQKTFCLICIGLFDFSRSDFSFMPVIERSWSEPKCISCSSVLRTEIHQIQSNIIKSFKKSFVWFVLVCLISCEATHEFRSLSAGWGAKSNQIEVSGDNNQNSCSKTCARAACV